MKESLTVFLKKVKIIWITILSFVHMSSFFLHFCIFDLGSKRHITACMIDCANKRVNKYVMINTSDIPGKRDQWIYLGEV